jgi:hypothetical protein
VYNYTNNVYNFGNNIQNTNMTTNYPSWSQAGSEQAAELAESYPGPAAPVYPGPDPWAPWAQAASQAGAAARGRLGPGGARPGPARSSHNDRVRRKGECCKVCQQPASGNHYGVMACEGCKSFFKRVVSENRDYGPCKHGGRCDVTNNSKQRCQPCRLAWCQGAGMKPELVQSKGAAGRKKKKKAMAIVMDKLDMDPGSFGHA